MRYDGQRIELGAGWHMAGRGATPLCAGERIIVYDEEMEVTATVQYDDTQHVWLAIPDWATRRDVEQEL